MSKNLLGNAPVIKVNNTTDMNHSLIFRLPDPRDLEANITLSEKWKILTASLCRSDFMLPTLVIFLAD